MKTEPIPNKRGWVRLVEPMEYRVILSDGTVIFQLVVPVGFETDYHSVPRLLWWLFPPHHNPEPSVAHDFLYRLAGVSRALADAIYRELMQQYGVGWTRRNTMYCAVRLFGWLHRRQNTI